jgi:hypothetical protein
MDIFNQQRPHEALDMKCPAESYQPSPRPYTGLPDIDYPFHDKTIVVTRCGRIGLQQKNQFQPGLRRAGRRHHVQKGVKGEFVIQFSFRFFPPSALRITRKYFWACSNLWAATRFGAGKGRPQIDRVEPRSRGWCSD